MPAKGEQLSAPPAEELPLTLSPEDRRRRVEAVRALDRKLEMTENKLLAALAQLPSLVREVQEARQVIRANTTAPSSPDTERE